MVPPDWGEAAYARRASLGEAIKRSAALATRVERVVEDGERRHTEKVSDLEGRLLLRDARYGRACSRAARFVETVEAAFGQHDDRVAKARHVGRTSAVLWKVDDLPRVAVLGHAKKDAV